MESLSANNCTISTTEFIVEGIYAPPIGKEADIIAKVIPPPERSMKRWKAIMEAQQPNASYAITHSKNKKKTYRQFIQITNNLCKSDLFAKFKLGHYAGTTRLCLCIRVVWKGIKECWAMII